MNTNSQDYKLGYLFGTLSIVRTRNIELDDYIKWVNEVVDELDIELNDKLVYKICELYCSDLEIIETLDGDVIAVGEECMRFGFVELLYNNKIDYHYDPPF